jgi:hypothetical protein
VVGPLLFAEKPAALFLIALGATGLAFVLVWCAAAGVRGAPWRCGGRRADVIRLDCYPTFALLILISSITNNGSNLIVGASMDKVYHRAVKFDSGAVWHFNVQAHACGICSRRC